MQRGHPDRVLRLRGAQRALVARALTRERRLAQFLLLGGTGEQDARAVLDRRLPGVGRLDHAHRGGHVSLEAHARPPRLVGDGEVGLAREQAVHLDEVGALVERRAHGGRALLGGADGDGVGPDRLRAVHDAARDDLPRADQVSRLLSRAPGMVQRGTEHLAHAGHAVHEEQQQLRRRVPVDVHVPQAGDQEATRRVEHVGVGGGRELGGRRDGLDAPVANEHGAVPEESARLHVHDRGVRERDHGRARSGGRQARPAHRLRCARRQDDGRRLVLGAEGRSRRDERRHEHRQQWALGRHAATDGHSHPKVPAVTSA
ncbi:MAG: hypothetical protein ACYTG2_03915 [Planctomycetota bacterium]